MKIISMEEARQLGDKFNTEEVVEAIEYFKKSKNSGGFASDVFDMKESLQMVKELYEAGANKVYVGELYTEPYRIKDEGDIYAATLFVVVDKSKASKVKDVIIKYSPDEYNIEKGIIRIWWD